MREGCTPDLITKFSWDVKTRSIHEEELSKTCVDSLITCCRPNCHVTFSIIFPSKLHLAFFLYQFFNFALKSPITTTKNGLFWTKLSKFNSENFSNSSWDWLGDLFKAII